MMWQVQVAKNTLKTFLPFQNRLRQLKRGMFGRSDGILESNVYSGGFDQIELLRENGADVRGRTVLEVGCGWYPVIPLMLALAGARRVIMTDVDRLMDMDGLRAAADFLRARKDDLARRLELPPEEITRFLDLAPDGTFEAELASRGMAYIVPFDYDRAPHDIDIIFSHTVFEHIPREILEDIVGDGCKVLKPGGIMSHGIDHSDHRSHRDPSLNKIDFLRFSAPVWKMLCLNPHDYTNRLRHSHYVDLFQRHGLEIVHERTFQGESCVSFAQTRSLAPPFDSLPVDDVAKVWSHILARTEPG